MEEDRYKIFIYDTVVRDGVGLYPQKRYALFDKLEKKTISEPCFKDTIDYTKLILAHKRLQYENSKEFMLYTKEILDYCKS